MPRLPHTQGKKIQYFYVHFLRFTFSYTIYKVKKNSLYKNLTCTEFVNPYSYGCTTTQIYLKLENYKHLTFFLTSCSVLAPIY